MELPMIKQRTYRRKRLSVTARKRSTPHMPTKALINTTLKISDGRANIHHVILIFLSELVLTCCYLLKLSADIQRKMLKLSRESSKRICRSGGESGSKRWNNRKGWNRGTLSYMYPLKKSNIDINRGCNSLPEWSNLRSLRRRVISIPKGSFLFGINKCSESRKSTMSLEMLTLMHFKRQ